MKPIKSFIAAMALLVIGWGTRASAQIKLPNPLDPDGTGGIRTFHDLLNSIIDGLLLFSIPIVVGVVMWGAYNLITSGGEPEKITKGKDAILYAVIGYVILLLAKGIELIIRNFLTTP